MLMNRKFSILHTLIILNLAIFSFLHSLSFQTGTFTSTNDIHRQVFLFSNISDTINFILIHISLC